MLVGRGHWEVKMKGRGFVMGQLALSKGPARWRFAIIDKEPIFHVRDFFHTIDLHTLNITKT
jgi:hypothetical protein